MLENKGRLEVSQMGKEELIKHLGEFFQLSNASSLSGIENDASVLKMGDQLTLTTSTLAIENVHFNLGYFPLKHLGYKTVAAAAADIVGMNGTPSQIRINIGASNRFSVEALEEFTAGVKFCCERYGIDLVGLNITSSNTGLIIGAQMIGTVKEKELVQRKGAAENELICVSGDLGAAYTGLLILNREMQVFAVNPTQQPDLEGYSYIIERQLKPEPRVDVIEDLKKAGILPTSMINVKNGLANALLHLCQQSDCGCTIYEEKLPVDLLTFDTLKELKIVATTIALNGGEDYEVLFTIKQEDYEKIKNLKEVSVIGHITAASAGKNLVTNDQKLIELQAQGFQGE
jgi:thiamine-monophosphate kinase